MHTNEDVFCFKAKYTGFDQPARVKAPYYGTLCFLRVSLDFLAFISNFAFQISFDFSAGYSDCIQQTVWRYLFLHSRKFETDEANVQI